MVTVFDSIPLIWAGWEMCVHWYGTQHNILNFQIDLFILVYRYNSGAILDVI